MHPLLLFDSRIPGELERVHKAGWDIMETSVKLGGTISGEHGIGQEKQEAMKMIFSSDDLNTQQTVKLAFDPGNVLNPNTEKLLSKKMQPWSLAKALVWLPELHQPGLPE